MKLQHLLELINELSPNTYFKYIRSDEQCEYISRGSIPKHLMGKIIVSQIHIFKF